MGFPVSTPSVVMHVHEQNPVFSKLLRPRPSLVTCHITSMFCGLPRKTGNNTAKNFNHYVEKAPFLAGSAKWNQTRKAEAFTVLAAIWLGWVTLSPLPSCQDCHLAKVTGCWRGSSGFRCPGLEFHTRNYLLVGFVDDTGALRNIY